jgi:hypothetical protein
MTAVVALFSGEREAELELVAFSLSPRLVASVASAMAEEPGSSSPMLAPLEEGRRSSLRLLAGGGQDGRS